MTECTRIMAAVVLAAAALSCGQPAEEVQEEEKQIPPIGFFVEDFDCEEGTVRSGDTFSSVMNRYGLDANDTYMLAMACDTLFDVTRMRAGNAVRAYTDTLTHELHYVVYDMDRIRQAVFRCKDTLGVRIYEKPVVKNRRYADGLPA